jgi:ribosomal protein S27AE
MSNSDWWAKQLGVKPTPQAAPQPQNNPMPPSQQPMTQYTPPQPQVPATRAISAQQTQLCPNCSSSNYMSVQGSKLRCYDCGYPLEQSGSKYGSLTGAKVVGDAKSARGNDTVSNWNPTTIVGRIDG